MTPRKDSRTPRIRRRLAKLGLPMLRLPSGAKTKAQHRAAEHVVDKLIADRQVGVLRALIDGPENGGVTLAQVIEADRAGQLTGAGVLVTIALRENLWTAATRLFGGRAIAPATAKRYLVAMNALRRKAARWLTADATLADLKVVPWPTLVATWGASGDDWMNLRRTVSRLLTLALRNKFHPARLEILEAIPTRPTRVRVPDFTQPVFWQVVDAAREDVRPAFVTLLLTGMRVKTEYCRCTDAHLRPHTCAVEVPGTKTAGSADVVRVAEEHWPWIVAAIPAPLGYKGLRREWNRACDRAGIAVYREWVEEQPDGTTKRRESYQGPGLHTLRHAHGQWATDAGVPLIHVKASMRHATLAQTEKYARQKAKGEVAAALGQRLTRPAVQPTDRPADPAAESA